MFRALVAQRRASILPMPEDSCNKLFREVPHKDLLIDTPHAAICKEKNIYVPQNFFPDLIASILISFRFVRLFDILRKTFDMTDLEEGRVLSQSSKLSVRSSSSMSRSDYFTPFIPVACGTSLRLEPHGDLVYVKNDNKLSPRQALLLPIRRFDTVVDVTPIQAAADRCFNPNMLVDELEYASMVHAPSRLSTIIAPPIQCIARSLMYVLVMRKLGYDAVYLRNDSHAIAMLNCDDGIPAHVECCTHLSLSSISYGHIAASNNMQVDDEFVRFYAMYRQMQARLGKQRSEQLVANFLSKSINQG